MTQQIFHLIENLTKGYSDEIPRNRAKLFGLAALRTIDDLKVVARVMSKGKSTSTATQTIQYLRRTYPFIFADSTCRHLQEEIRNFLRQRLLEHRYEKEISDLLLTIHKNQYDKFRKIDQAGTFLDLRAKICDESWGEAFLDRLEALFWINPSDGINNATPILLIASLYHPHLVHHIERLCTFFRNELSDVEREYWLDICQSFNLAETTSHPQEKLTAIDRLKKRLVGENQFLDAHFKTNHRQILAALSWQTGELYREINMLKEAASAYLEALPVLYPEEQVSVYTAKLYKKIADIDPDSISLLRIDFLHEAITYKADFDEAYYSLGDIYFERSEYRQAITYYQYAIELKPYDFEAWVNLGIIHTRLKEYQRALDEFNYAERLNPRCAHLYLARGNVYYQLQSYNDALSDFKQAIHIDPAYAEAYTNRGNVYAMLNQPELARRDYEQTLALQPNNMQALWLREWLDFGKQPVTVRETKSLAQRLLNIAEQDRQHYLATVCTGLAQGFTQKPTKLALPILERSCQEAPDQWDSFFWLAMVAAYCYRTEQAAAALHEAIQWGLPTAFLSPLYWLEKDRPDFFNADVLPLLKNHIYYQKIL